MRNEKITNLLINHYELENNSINQSNNDRVIVINSNDDELIAVLYGNNDKIIANLNNELNDYFIVNSSKLIHVNLEEYFITGNYS